MRAFIFMPSYATFNNVRAGREEIQFMGGIRWIQLNRKHRRKLHRREHFIQGVSVTAKPIVYRWFSIQQWGGKGCWCFLTNVMFRLLLSDSVFMFCYLPIVNTSNVQTPHFMYFISFYYYGHLNFISQTYFKNLWKMLSKKKKKALK